MEAPLCRSCSTRHWPKNPCKWPVTVSADGLVAVNESVRAVNKTVNNDVTVSVAVNTRAEYMKAYMRTYRKGKAWPKRDRAEYMRKYRAKDAQAK